MSSSYNTTNNAGTRTTTYGYGLNDITMARESLERQSAFSRFNLDRQFKDLGTQQRGKMNQRGMIDSGVAKKASERLAGDKELQSWGLEGQIMEAQAQLDRQRSLIEDQFSASAMDEAIANALRRLGVSQTLQGLGS